MSGDIGGKPKLVIERVAMTGNARSEGGTVIATSGGADHIPDGMDVKIQEIGMTGYASQTNTNVQASKDRNLFVGETPFDTVTLRSLCETGLCFGQAAQEDQVDGTAEKSDSTFGHPNAAALLLAGAGSSSQVFKYDVDRMVELLKGSSVGISEDKIFTVKPRPTIKKTTKTSVHEAISDVKDVLEGSDNGHLVFYYTGHFGKKGFKVDEKKNPEVDYYLDKELAHDLMEIPAKYVLLIMDMCYSGSAELGAKDDDGLQEEDEEEGAEPNLWEFYTESIGTKDGDGDAACIAEKIVQWSSSGHEVSFTHNPSQSSFFTKAIIDVITRPEAGKGIRDELAPGQTHVSVLHLHKHVSQHVKTALQKHKASQTPVIKPPHADSEYFKAFPFFAKLV